MYTPTICQVKTCVVLIVPPGGCCTLPPHEFHVLHGLAALLLLALPTISSQPRIFGKLVNKLPFLLKGDKCLFTRSTMSSPWPTPPYSFINAESLAALMKSKDRTELDLLVIDVRVCCPLLSVKS